MTLEQRPPDDEWSRELTPNCAKLGRRGGGLAVVAASAASSGKRPPAV